MIQMCVGEVMFRKFQSWSRDVSGEKYAVGMSRSRQRERDRAQFPIESSRVNFRHGLLPQFLKTHQQQNKSSSALLKIIQHSSQRPFGSSLVISYVMGATSLERVWREKFGVWCFSWVVDALDKNGKESGVILLGMDVILFGFEINLIFECKLTPQILPQSNFLIQTRLNPFSHLFMSAPFPRPLVAGDSLTISDNSQRNTNSANLIKMQEEFAFKILLVGNLGVGKSSLLLRYAEGSFKEDLLPTVGLDFRIRTVQQAGSAVHLQLWDTAGQQRMKALSAGFYRRAHGLLVVFDLSDRRSFLDVRGWLQQAKLYGSGQAVGVLVGNKNDLSRVVSREQAEKLAASEGMRYFEVSAKTNTGVEEAFSTLSSSSMEGFSEAYIAKYKKTQTYLQSTKGNTTTKQSCC